MGLMVLDNLKINLIIYEYSKHMVMWVNMAALYFKPNYQVIQIENYDMKTNSYFMFTGESMVTKLIKLCKTARVSLINENMNFLGQF